MSEDPALQEKEAKAAEIRRSIQENRARQLAEAERAKPVDKNEQLKERLEVIPPGLINANVLRGQAAPGGTPGPAKAKPDDGPTDGN